MARDIVGDRMDQNLKRSIILDNYQNPYNKDVSDVDGYIKINTNNQSCIDNLDIYVKLKDNIIEDIKFDGEACVICISSTSIMVRSLIGKTLEEALVIINNYLNMIEEKEYDENILGELNVYNDLYKQPSRKKCATLSTLGIEKIINSNCKNN